MQVWVILYAIGAAQAALLALALWRRRQNATANRVLAAWVAVVCVDLVVKAAYLSAPSPEWFRAFRFVWLFPFLYGSLFYLYVRTLVTARAPRPRDVLHLAGFALMAALTAPAWLASPEGIAAQFARYGIGGWPPPLPGYDLILFAYSLSYVGAALWCLYRYRRALRAQRSDADRWSLRWVEALALAQLAIWCIAVVQVALKSSLIGYYLIYAAVAVWVCIVGWFNLVQPAVASAEGEADAEDAVATQATSPVAEAPEDSRVPAVEARLQQLMHDEALYRAPALTIGQLARRSGYPEYLVSAVINRRFGATFWDWINQLRVDAVRAHLDDPHESRTLLDIAYDCGFTAKSTFNSAFKRRVGRTPSEYRRAALAASAKPRHS